VKCSACGSAVSQVIDSRPAKNDSVRRRRKCVTCKFRFTTYEYIEGNLGSEKLRAVIAFALEKYSELKKET
jgi:transcriptional regulator NrdR family protein